MRAYAHDILRTLRSPSVLIVLVLVLLVGIAPGLFLSEVGRSAATIAWGYGENASDYLVVAYVANAVGNPVDGLTIELQAGQSNPIVGGTALTVYANASTNAQGIVRFAVPYSPLGYFVSIGVSNPFGPSGGAGAEMSPLPPGSFGAGTNNLGSIAHGLFPAGQSLLVMLVAPTGDAPNSLVVAWAPAFTAGGPPAAPVQSLGVMNAYATTFVMPTSPDASTYPFVYVQVTDANGTIVLNGTFGSSGSELPPPGAEVPAPLFDLGAAAYAVVALLVGVLAPIFGFLAAYSAYARDRLTGVLENVLARPVTRGGLLASRYLAVVVALAIGLGAMVGVLQLGVYLGTTAGFGIEPLLVLYGGALVVALGFAGLTLLFAHLLRSTSSLIGLFVGLYFLLVFFWYALAAVLEALWAAAGNTGAANDVLLINLANPAQYLNVVTTVLGSSFGSSSTFGASGGALVLIVLVGLCWPILPFLGARYRATRND